MNRLTERDEFGNADVIKCPTRHFTNGLSFNELSAMTNALNKLAAYEDTGLEPSEVAALESKIKNKIWEQITGKTTAEILKEQSKQIAALKEEAKINYESFVAERDCRYVLEGALELIDKTDSTFWHNWFIDHKHGGIKDYFKQQAEREIKEGKGNELKNR